MATHALHTGHDGQEEQPGGALLATLPMVILERKWLLIVPAALTTIAGAVAAFVMHPVYQSSATLLIESQQIPGVMIGQPTDMGDVIGERVARARERVLSRMDLIRLIRTYDLYPDQLKKMPLSKVVDLMRESTMIAAGGSSLALGGQHGGGDAISVTVSFDYDDPVKAQIVTQQFVNRLLDIDAAAQASQAQDTVNFLNEEATRIRSQIATVDDQINKIKASNGTVLALGQASGDPVADLSRINSDIAGLQAESARLALMPNTSNEDVGGVAAAEAALRVAEAKFSDSHPDVVAAKAQVAAARAAAAAAPRGGSVIAAQLASNRAQLASLQAARALIASHSSAAQAAQARAPALQAQVEQLEKQSSSLHLQYDSIGGRLQTAQIQARVENEQKGERLTLADPPVVPDHPVKPNRPVLILGSMAAGAALGVALILLIELVLRPIRGTGALREAVGQPPLAIIPDFDQKPGRIMRYVEKRVRRKAAVRG